MLPINLYNTIWPPAASVRSPHINGDLGIVRTDKHLTDR